MPEIKTTKPQNIIPIKPTPPSGRVVTEGLKPKPPAIPGMIKK